MAFALLFAYVLGGIVYGLILQVRGWEEIAEWSDRDDADWSAQAQPKDRL